MGAKHKDKVNENPGPGQYSHNASMRGSFQGSFAHQKKKEIFDQKQDMPGPGNYNNDTSTFGKGKGQAMTISGRH